MAVICPLVFMLLTPDLQVRELAAQVLRIGLIAEPLFGVSIVAAGALRGTGDTFVPGIMNIGSVWIPPLLTLPVTVILQYGVL
jgi:Na+-driven multidrug efflux pump